MRIPLTKYSKILIRFDSLYNWTIFSYTFITRTLYYLLSLAWHIESYLFELELFIGEDSEILHFIDGIFLSPCLFLFIVHSLKEVKYDNARHLSLVRISSDSKKQIYIMLRILLVILAILLRVPCFVLYMLPSVRESYDLKEVNYRSCLKLY